jgi:putative membrane protein
MRGINKPPFRFLLRWLVCSVGLWIAAAFLGRSIDYGHSAFVIIVAGLILAVINTVLKPMLVILSLPAILFSLGLFMIIINGVTVFIASKVYHPLHITNFWAAVFAGIVIGLVNYLVTTVLEDVKS